MRPAVTFNEVSYPQISQIFADKNQPSLICGNLRNLWMKPSGSLIGPITDLDMSSLNTIRSRIVLTRTSFIVATIAAMLKFADIAMACPICGVPTVTVAERYARADAALLAEWVSVRGAQGTTPETTAFEIVQTPRNPEEAFKNGERIDVPVYAQGKSGDLYLLLGRKDEKLGIKWENPLPVSETSFQYIVQAPPLETPAEKRLAYFVKFLEFPDVTIANDAFAQFVNAPTKDIAAVSGKLPKDKIRRWLADSKTPINRQAGYGLMLGLCGGGDEARFLEERIGAIGPDRQVGIEGLMFGYLLLTGENGLANLEKKYLADSKTEDGMVYAAVLAIRYYWTYGNGKIAPEKLRAAMRRMLDRPAFAESAIKDLARWKDWGLHEQLMKLYESKAGADTSMKKAIITYMIASTKDGPQDAADAPPHVRSGRKCLEQLRQRDPRLVTETEKFFFVQ
jgi:hypothetical protein